MSGAARKPRYERQVASDRREALVDAAIESLKRYGYEGLSVRRIAAEAGVSIGLINHHFPNKDTLVAESYRTFGRRLAANFEAAVAAAGPDPRARLRAYLDAFFSGPNLNPQVLTAWVVYWSLVQVSPEMRRCATRRARATARCSGSCCPTSRKRAAALSVDLGLAVTGLTALLDGLWLQLCLDPTSIRPKDAAALCDDWVDRVVGA